MTIKYKDIIKNKKLKEFIEDDDDE